MHIQTIRQEHSNHTFEQDSLNWTDIKQSLTFSFQSLRDRGSLVAARDNVEVGVVNDLNSQLKRVEHELASIRSTHWRNSILVASWKQSSIFVQGAINSRTLSTSRVASGTIEGQGHSHIWHARLEGPRATRTTDANLDCTIFFQ